MLRRVQRQGRRRRGGVLVSTLVFVVVTSFILAGIGTFAVSHLSRANTDSSYAAALNLAEAGINYELDNISSNITNATLAHQLHPGAGMNGPFTGSITGLSGSFTVSVTNDPDDGQPWYPPSSVLITASGTLNGVTRTVRCRGARRSLFDNYAFYGIDSTTINSSLIATGKLGSDSALTLNSGSTEIYGPVIFNGTYGSFPSSQTTGGVWRQPDKILWPTVNQIADSAASQIAGYPVTAGTGLTYLKAHNDNSRIQMFSSTDATLTNPAQHAWITANFTTDAGGNWVIGDAGGFSTFNSVNTDGNAMDATGANPARYVLPTTTYTFTNPSNAVSVGGTQLIGMKVLILPGSTTGTPYNYYFDLLSLKSKDTNTAILVDTAAGPVNIWLGPSTAYGSMADSLSGVVFFTSQTDSTKFRLYDGKTATLTIGGRSVFPGGIYVYNGANVGSVTLGGSPAILGSLIADGVTVSGNTFINYPTNMHTGNDYGLWYGFLNQWTEVNGM